MREMESGTRPLVLVAACVLLDGNRRILIAKRPPGRSLAGLWEFPGGKVEPGESPEHALVRELAGSASRSRQPISRRSHSRATLTRTSTCSCRSSSAAAGGER